MVGDAATHTTRDGTAQAPALGISRSLGVLVGLVLPMSALTSAGGAGLGDPEGWCPGPHRHLWLMAELLLLTHQ